MTPQGNERINIMGIFLNKTDYEDALRRIESLLKSTSPAMVVTPNAEIIMAAQKNEKLRLALNSADLCFPDGIGVVLASKIMGKPLYQRTAGFDLMVKMLDMSRRKSLSVFLLGGRPGVAEEAAQNIKRKYPDIKIAGTCHGYFGEKEETDIINKINNSGADILLVALGAPKQELFMASNRKKLKCKVMMGVGGSLDVLSGRVNRAPVFMQEAGLEWLYRLITQPTRIKRMSALPLFLIRVLVDKLKQ